MLLSHLREFLITNRIFYLLFGSVLLEFDQYLEIYILLISTWKFISY